MNDINDIIGRKHNNKGFTLIELIVVIAIMAVLVGILAPTLTENINKSKKAVDIENADSIRKSIELAAITDEDLNDFITKAISWTPEARNWERQTNNQYYRVLAYINVPVGEHRNYRTDLHIVATSGVSAEQKEKVNQILRDTVPNSMVGL